MKWKEGVHSSFFDASLFLLSNKNSSLSLSKSLLTLLKTERKEVNKKNKINEHLFLSQSKRKTTSIMRKNKGTERGKQLLCFYNLKAM